MVCMCPLKQGSWGSHAAHGGERERGGTLACRRRLLALGLVGGVEDHAVVQRVARLLVAQHSAAAAGALRRSTDRS